MSIEITTEEIHDALETALERKPTMKEFIDYRSWVIGDIHEWLKDNTKSYLEHTDR